MTELLRVDTIDHRLSQYPYYIYEQMINKVEKWAQ
jgi:hypothetical protein